ncbi:MAG TPA: PAS domain-containing sensor histidine kinase, partial [Trichocoleus sp.]
ATQEALYRLATGAPTVQFENRCHCCDDSYRWISWSVTLTGTGEKLFMVGRDITQEKQIALTLLEQQRQLSAITRNVPVGVYRFIYHCDGRISMPYASEAYQTLVGLSPSYLMAHPQALMALIQPEDRDELQGVIEKVQQTRTSQGIAEYRLQLPSGEIKWVSDRTHFSWNETGDLIVDGIHTDICDRKQFETALRVLNQNLEDIVELRTEELQQSNNRLRQEIVERELVEVALQNSQRFLELVLDSIPQAVFWKDRNGIYQGCNRNFAQDVGLASNEEIVGKCDRDLLWWDGQTEHYRQRERLILTTGNPELHIIEIQHQTDGQTRWLETSKVPLHDSNGHIIGILGSYEDITARIQAEEALQASQRFVQSIADTSPSILYIYDVQEKCNVYANQELVGTLGYSLEELQQLNQDIIPRLTHPDDHALVGKHHQQLSQAKDGEILEVEYRMRHANGKWRWLRSRDTVFSRNDEGQVKQIIGVALDISDRKRAEAEILRTLEREKELNALKSRFISMASHELRTPLTTILGSTELLQYSSHKWSEEKKQRHFEQIKNTVHHMTRLVDDVLLYSKVEADRSSCNPAPLDLVMFCQDLIEELTMSEAFPNRILLEAPDSGCEFPVDKHLLRQILVNLLGNSLKYSSSTTSVYLRINCQDNQVTLQIRDGGIGIPVQDIPYLYKSFHRGTNVGSIPGTGLGLPIVKRAVDMHQGQLIVESEESRGTLVTVILPCR